MKLSVKKIDALRRELRFEVPKDRVRQKMEEVYTNLAKVANVKGFRRGKVPRHVLEREHSSLAKEEVLKKIIPEVYSEGIAKEEMTPLDLPEIHDVEFKDGIVKFTARIDLKPDVKIEKYRGICVKKKKADVTDEEINRTLEYFKKSLNRDNDKPLDDDFAKGLGYPSVDMFKQALSRQLAIDKDRQNRFDIENQIGEALLKEAKLAVPASFVKKQLEYRIDEMKKRFSEQGLSDADIKKKEEDLRKELQKPVEKDVKLYLIFDKIAEKENISIKEGESLSRKVMEFLLKEAQWRDEVFQAKE